MTSFPYKVRGFIGQNPRKARGNGAPRGRRVGKVPNNVPITTYAYTYMSV